MEKYTLRDIASNKFRLLTEFDIVRIEDVESVTIRFNGEKKVVVIHIGPYDYFFNSSLKDAVKSKIASDLITNQNVIYQFAV